MPTGSALRTFTHDRDISAMGCCCYLSNPIRLITLHEELAMVDPVTVIGVVSAAIILGEPLGLREVAAMVLTLGGVTLALQKA